MKMHTVVICKYLITLTLSAISWNRCNVSNMNRSYSGIRVQSGRRKCCTYTIYCSGFMSLQYCWRTIQSRPIKVYWSCRELLHGPPTKERMRMVRIFARSRSQPESRDSQEKRDEPKVVPPIYKNEIRKYVYVNKRTIGIRNSER